jgi:hypothetical protein
MFWWIAGAITAVAVLGYVAHKFPTWFGLAVDEGAAIVNKIDDSVKTSVKGTANTQ